MNILNTIKTYWI